MRLFHPEIGFYRENVQIIIQSSLTMAANNLPYTQAVPSSSSKGTSYILGEKVN
jgi:hypothetical protein